MKAGLFVVSGLAALLTLTGIVIGGRDELAARFPASARAVCEILGCRPPMNPHFELLRVEARDSGDRRRGSSGVRLEVTYRSTEPGLSPFVDVVVIDQDSVRGHASVAITEPRPIDGALRAAIVLPLDGIEPDAASFEVTLR